MKNAIALGTFDGLHKGHLAVLELPDCYNKIALTFEIPPKAVMTGEPLSLTTFTQKEKRLREMGIKAVKLKFNEISHISAEDFLLTVKEEFDPAFISCGYNYRFGKGGKGDTALLETFCRDNNIILKVCEPVTEGGSAVSSSRIREFLKNGETEIANQLLSEPFSYEGKVLHGDGRGKTLGFPTINQRYPEELIPLKFGVYRTKVYIEGKEYIGITDIGKRPTYPVDFIISETFVKDFSGDVYGKNVKIIPSEFLRPEVKFGSFEKLKEQLEKDIESIR